MAVAKAYGPRIVGFSRSGGPQLLAKLTDDVVIEHPDSGVYLPRGGHRLWVSPEVPAVSYASDDHPCQIEAGADRIEVTAPGDSAGFLKRIAVQVAGDGVEVQHTLTNGRSDPMAVAAWAITQLPLGGVAILPLGMGAEAGSYQPDRHLVVWPYTALDDPRIGWAENTVTIDGVPGPRLKLGVGPRPQRLGYLRDGWLFAKQAPAAIDGEYPDLGAVAQVFCDADFLELETLGPLVRLESGQSVTHREVWSAQPCQDLAGALESVALEPIGGDL